MVECWNSLDVLVRVKQVVVTWMAETLMPEKTFRFRLYRLNGSILLDIFMKWKVVIHSREISHLLSQRREFLLLVGMDSLNRGKLARPGKCGIRCNCLST